MATEYCPRCEPNRDNLKEILEVRYCFIHQPQMFGSADNQTPPVDAGWSTPMEAGGEENRKWCDFIRGEGWRN